MIIFLVIVLLPIILCAICLPWWFTNAKGEAKRQAERERLALSLSPLHHKARQLDYSDREQAHRHRMDWAKFAHSERYVPAGITVLGVSAQTQWYTTPAAPRTMVQEVVSTPPAAIEAPAFKSFAELLSDGTISRAMRQGQLVMGYQQSAATKAWELRYGSWLDLYSCAVAGVSGSGKTTTVLFLLLQAILAGAKLMVIDPHIADPEESLAARLELFSDAMIVPPCDHTPKEVLRRIRWLKKELTRRKEHGIKPPACDRIVFVIDEFNSIMQKGGDLAEELQALLLEVEQEGRKFGMFAMLIGQNWSANSIGDAVIRQCLASALVHRMSEVAQAKKLLPLSKHANATIELDQGYWMFKDTRGQFTNMYTPYTDEFDSPQVARYLPVQNVFRPSGQAVNRVVQDVNTSPSLHIVNSVNTEYSPVQYNPEYAEQVQILQNTTTMGKIAIIEKVWDVKRGGSAAWKQAVVEYDAIIAEIEQMKEEA